MTPEWQAAFRGNASVILTAGVSTWFAAWGIRYRWKLDLPGDLRSRILRWSLALPLLALASIPEPRLKVVRLISMTCFSAVLAWPNLSVYLVRLYDRLRGSGVAV